MKQEKKKKKKEKEKKKKVELTGIKYWRSVGNKYQDGMLVLQMNRIQSFKSLFTAAFTTVAFFWSDLATNRISSYLSGSLTAAAY